MDCLCPGGHPEGSRGGILTTATLAVPSEEINRLDKCFEIEQVSLAIQSLDALLSTFRHQIDSGLLYLGEASK